MRTDAAQVTRFQLMPATTEKGQALATFPLTSGDLPAEFVPDILVYEAGRYVLIDETKRRIRIYNDMGVNSSIQGPQGNPELSDEEL